LAAAGATTLALQSEALDFASSLLAAPAKAAAKPVIHAVFVRPKITPLVSWPGGQTDVAAQQALFAKTIAETAQKLGVQLEMRTEPLENRQQIDQYLAQLKKAPPDGLLVLAMELTLWPDVQHLVEKRGDIPTVVYSNLTSFTGHMRGTRKVPKTYVGATQDVGWLAFGLRMLWATWRMKHARILFVAGDKTADTPVPGLGTLFHWIPKGRFEEEFKKVAVTDEVRAIADFYAKNAEKIVEPSKAEIVEAAKNYVVCRRLLEMEKCEGLAIDCLGWKNPVCVAYCKLRDEGIVAACEADANATLSMLITHLLFNRPGFQQDPSANTVNNTLIGAHCTSPTKLEGFDKPYRAPYLLRNYHTRTGVSPEVLWPVGRDVTVMQMSGTQQMILGSGKVVSNIAQPPSGCCRTSVEITVDGVADTDDCKGFHQLFILGALERDFRAFCQLTGIQPVHI